MRDTRINVKIWERMTNADLTSEAKLVLLNLYTSFRRNLFGITVVDQGMIHHETGLSREQVKDAIDELTEKDFIFQGDRKEYLIKKYLLDNPFVAGCTYSIYKQSIDESDDKSLIHLLLSEYDGKIPAPVAAALIDKNIVPRSEFSISDEKLDAARNGNRAKKEV